MLDAVQETAVVDDVGLIQRVAAGERRAFDALVHRHHASLFRFARGLTGNADTAEDVVQETLLAAYRNAGAFEGRSSVRTWLFGIAYRQSLKSRRRRAGEPAELEPLAELGVAAGWGAEETPESLASSARLRDCLRASLATLDDDDQGVLILRDVEGLSGPETAEALGLGLAATKSRLHRARLKLAAAVREAGCRDGA